MVATAPLAKQIIERLNHEKVIFIDATIDEYWDLAFVSTFIKQQDNRHWLNKDFDTLEMNVGLGNFTIPMQDIYHKAEVKSAGKA